MRAASIPIQQFLRLFALQARENELFSAFQARNDAGPFAKRKVKWNDNYTAPRYPLIASRWALQMSGRNWRSPRATTNCWCDHTTGDVMTVAANSVAAISG
jgi:hypothetical protein